MPPFERQITHAERAERLTMGWLTDCKCWWEGVPNRSTRSHCAVGQRVRLP